MSELQNPLFDEEKEFLERKKLEYERALLGDVEHIKEQSATVGKVALVGAGLAGTVWLISKAFGGKKRRHEGKHRPDGKHKSDGRPDAKGKGKDKSQSKDKHKSAAASAMVFMDHFEDGDHEFGGSVARPNTTPQSAPRAAQPVGALVNSASRPAEKTPDAKPVTPAAFAPAVAPASAPAPKAADKPAASKPAPVPADATPANSNEDPFQDLPYDDSRRLTASKSFSKEAKNSAEKEAKDNEGVPTPAMAEVPRHSVARVVGSVLQQFLQSDTGKVLVAQAGALALAAVTKKAGELFPAAKNADLADSSDAQPADTAAAPVVSSAPSASPDASKSPQSV